MERNTKYKSLYEVLRREILDGKYDRHERFPSEGQLVRRFGVSRPTVERALLELKHEGLLGSRAGSGFFLSALAREPVGNLGVIVPDYLKIDFFTTVCNELARAGRAAGYNVLLGDIPRDGDRVQDTLALAHRLAAKRVAGVFLEPIDLVSDSATATRTVIRILTEANIPVVLLDRDIEPPPSRSGYDLVGIDNVQAGYRAARHLLERGAKNIRFLTCPDAASTIRQRIQGVAQAVMDAGLKWSASHVIDCDPSDTKAIAALFRKSTPPDAFVCRNDPLAGYLLQTLVRLGKRVPRDVMVAGFDDAEFAQFLSPALTSIRQPCRLIAEAALETLLQRIRRPNMPARAVLLDVELIPRASTARTNAHARVNSRAVRGSRPGAETRCGRALPRRDA